MLSKGIVHVNTDDGQVTIDYKEHDTRNGKLLVEVDRKPMGISALLELVQKLEKEEKDLRIGRERYQRMFEQQLGLEVLAVEEDDDEDDEEEELDFDEVVQNKGDLIAYQDWDSGGSGAGAGRVELYEYEDRYYVFHDAGVDNYDDPVEAAQGILGRNSATVEIWVDESLKRLLKERGEQP